MELFMIISMLHKVLMPLLVLIFITSCSTFDPYTGEKKVSNTAKGASIGAGVAAIAAYLASKDEDSSRKRNQRILRAAGGGAAIGGGIGYYMDAQEAKLRQQLGDSGVSVARDGDNINLLLPGNITFPTGKSSLNASFYSVLDSVALVLEEYNKTLIIISGHTDSTGSTAINQQLSNNRAASVSSYLSSKGVLAERLETIGFASRKPIASNSTASGREQNRRVEMALIPIETQ
jgi:outer membrane protein OmpA-like peptidoglycan-associated protein